MASILHKVPAHESHWLFYDISVYNKKKGYRIPSSCFYHVNYRGRIIVDHTKKPITPMKMEKREGGRGGGRGIHKRFSQNTQTTKEVCVLFYESYQLCLISLVSSIRSNDQWQVYIFSTTRISLKSLFANHLGSR